MTMENIFYKAVKDAVKTYLEENPESITGDDAKDADPLDSPFPWIFTKLQTKKVLDSGLQGKWGMKTYRHVIEFGKRRAKQVRGVGERSLSELDRVMEQAGFTDLWGNS